MKTYKTRKYLISAGAGLLACMFTQPLLAAINLSNVPLIAATNVDPNMMFLIDTSGSMEHVVVDKPYDASITYSTCNPPKIKGVTGSALPDTNVYSLSVSSTGVAKIKTSSFTDFWAKDTDMRCFTPTAKYKANLSTSSVLDDHPYEYDGNYLNWYFSNASTENLTSATAAANFGGANINPKTKSRMEVTRNALTTLVTNSIRKAYVGLTIFETGSSASDNGANVVRNLADINAGSNKSTLLSTINGLSASGGTPLASALAQLGRYFVTTDPEQELTFTSPNNNVSSPKQAYALFDTPPKSVAATPPAPADGYILKSCQKNFIISMTDGEPSPADTNYKDDLGKWADGDGTKTALNDFDDIAGALYDIDLRPDLGKDVKNNIVSYVIGFDKDIPLLKRAALLGNGIQPNPETLPDSDALVDSSGSTNDSTGYYFTATNTSELSTAFDKIATDIDAQDGAMSSVAFNSSQLEQNSAIYQATFNTGRWYGSLNAIPLTDSGDIEYDTQTPPAPITSWKAGDTLDAMTYTNRKIFTFDNTASPPDGKAFIWTNLNVNQKDDLRKDGVDSDNNLTVNDTDAENLLAYLIGDRTREGTSATHYRTRESRLGDIVNSAPVFVGKPQMNWPDYIDDNRFGSSGKEYSTYKDSTTVKSRTPVVYVGANDGMLHGFDASIPGTGAEVFAYIPGLLYSNESNKGLHYLASQQYEHRFYVDLTPAVSDVYIPTVSAGTADWRTVLVGGLQAGGKGLFALDVSKPSLFSNPSNYADDVVLWEFDGSHADMGHVFGTPTIAMMANGKWAVISANGYDSSSGLAKLFIIFLEEGLDGTWTVNTDYIALDTGVGSDNGLSSARAIDFDGDSVVDMIYAGDLKGNMWAFDVSDASTGSWSKRKLFTAINADGVAQPITSTPIVALNPNNPATPSASYPNVLVMFGTGQYLVSDDNSSKSKMAYYAVWDNGASDLTRSNLAARIQATTGSTRTISGTAVDWSTQKGWYIDLLNNTAAEGERVVADSLLRRQVLFFNTIIPNVDDCETSGSGWLMSVQYDTGLAPGFGVFDGNNDGLIDSNDLGFVGEKFDEGMPTKSGVLGERQYTPGTKGTIEDREVNVGPGNREGQLSWHEIFRD